MKIPSIDQILGKITSTFKRFPIAVLAALVGTLISVYAIENSINDDWVIRVLFVESLSAFMFTALALIGETVNKLSLASISCTESVASICVVAVFVIIGKL